jgi:FKBP-type peptidyl-prolyl cis-trans isomerase (trigger factor)
MASVMEKKENNVVVLTIDVSPESFADALQRSFKKNAGRFSVPGFRKGKAPMHIVTKYYGEGVLYDDAIDFAPTRPTWQRLPSTVSRRFPVPTSTSSRSAAMRA